MDNELRQVYRLTAGDRNDLVIAEEHIAPPSEHEVQVKVKAIGLNFADIFSVWGLYSATPKGAFIPGLEFAGDIVAVGKSVTHHTIGDRVFGITRFGAYATVVNLSAQYVFALPQNWSYAHGAAYPVQALTALYGLQSLGNLQAGHEVLVHSAAGGVGVWAGRICRAMDARAVGTVGRPNKVDFAKQQGYAEVIVRPANVNALGSVLAKASSKAGYDVIMEPTGGRVLEESWKLLLPEGRMIVYGSAHFASNRAKPNKLRLLWKYIRRPKLDPQAMIAENKGVLAFNLIWLYEQTEKLHQLMQELSDLDLGKPEIGAEFPFQALPQAVSKLQSGRSTGKVVVLI